jgi:dolichol kinase
MKTEIPRQFVHLSGLIFIVLAQFIGGLVVSFYCLFIAFTLLVYSEYVRRVEQRLEKFIHRFESRIRDFVNRFDRMEVARPFTGAFWFYIAFGFALLIFPLRVASAACVILAVGDSLSTLIGNPWGRHRIGRKSLEGSLAFLVPSFLVASLFVGPLAAFIGAVAGTIAELAPELGFLRNLHRRGILDDNLLIPLVSGAVMWAAITLG